MSKQIIKKGDRVYTNSYYFEKTSARAFLSNLKVVKVKGNLVTVERVSKSGNKYYQTFHKDFLNKESEEDEKRTVKRQYLGDEK